MDKKNIIALLLLMMEVLPFSARIITPSHGQRVKKKTQVLCVGGKWFQVGSFRFWERSKCGQRRQSGKEPPGTGENGGNAPPSPPPGSKEGPSTRDTTHVPRTTIDFDLILPSMEGGPKRNQSYDPNYGYEPYWAQGDWVFDKSPYVKDTTVFMCGVKCPVIYTEYGKVCGQNKESKYQTFENYCELRSSDCSDVNRWRMLYRGSCYRELIKYYPVSQKSEAIKMIQDFMELYTNHQAYVGFCKGCPTSIIYNNYDFFYDNNNYQKG